MNSALVLAHAHKLLVYCLDAESYLPSAQPLSLPLANPVLGRDSPLMCGYTTFYFAALEGDKINVLVTVHLPKYPMSSSRVSTLKRKYLLALVSQRKVALRFRGPQCIWKANQSLYRSLRSGEAAKLAVT